MNKIRKCMHYTASWDKFGGGGLMSARAIYSFCYDLVRIICWFVNGYQVVMVWSIMGNFIPTWDLI